MPPTFVRLAPGLAIALGAIGVAIAQRATEEELPGRAWKLETPAPAESPATEFNPAWEEQSCTECHRTIAHEWAGTRHGQAWNEELYQEELAKIRKKSKCTSCHAPEPLLVAGITKRPKTREENVHWGVDCQTCHLGPGGEIHGPWGEEQEAHGSLKDELFTELGSNELCLSCHSRSVGPVIGIGRDFDDEELGERGFSCVGCHMAPVERPIANDPEGKIEYAPRKGRSHALQTPRDPGFLRQAFGLSARRTEGGVVLRVANRAGHQIPGLNDRLIIFQVRALDARGELVAEDELEISRSEAIELGQTLELGLEGADIARLAVTGVHEAKSLVEAVEFCREELTPAD